MPPLNPPPRIAPGEAPKRTSITLPVRRASKSAAWEGSRAWPPDHHLPNGNLTLFPQPLVALRGCSAAQRGGFCSRWIKANGSRHSTTRLCTSSRRSGLESSLRNGVRSFAAMLAPFRSFDLAPPGVAEGHLGACHTANRSTARRTSLSGETCDALSKIVRWPGVRKCQQAAKPPGTLLYATAVSLLGNPSHQLQYVSLVAIREVDEPPLAESLGHLTHGTASLCQHQVPALPARSAAADSPLEDQTIAAPLCRHDGNDPRGTNFPGECGSRAALGPSSATFGRCCSPLTTTRAIRFADQPPPSGGPIAASRKWPPPARWSRTSRAQSPVSRGRGC